MRLIASADRRWGIGKNNDLLFHASPDMKFFKETTMGGTVIMGHSTFLSLPGQQPLPGRDNIVLSRRMQPKDGVTVVPDIETLLRIIAPRDPAKVFAIGGQSVYEQLLPYCDAALITRFDAERDADRFLHDFDSDPAWELTARSAPVEWRDLRFTFDTYQRTSQ